MFPHGARVSPTASLPSPWGDDGVGSCQDTVVLCPFRLVGAARCPNSSGVSWGGLAR